MSKPADDGSYLYENKDLGFNLKLPKEFQYYQTQRTQGDGYVDLEIFVPTSDTKYLQEVPGYAKPLTVRIINRDVWDKKEENFDLRLTEKVGEKNDKIYTLVFWDSAPGDWRAKWNKPMLDSIRENFKIY